jgi:hypothetical protein
LDTICHLTEFIVFGLPGIACQGFSFVGPSVAFIDFGAFAQGRFRRGVTLPDEICGPMGKAVLDELVARGLAVKGPTLQLGDQ